MHPVHASASLVSVMKLYADLAPRRSRQILADVLVLVWCVFWVLAARAVRSAVMTLSAPGHRLESAGSSFEDRMLRAGERVDDLPLIADRLAGPLRDVSGVGSEIAGAGADLVSAVERLALISALSTALIPITIVVAGWLFFRLRWVRRATTARRFIDSGADVDLFALRALANQPMHRLARVSPDPVGAWRRGETDVVGALVGLELADVGLHYPGQT